MSKTTLRKRIALTATTALFAGMLSFVAAPSASAAVGDTNLSLAQGAADTGLFVATQNSTSGVSINSSATDTASAYVNARSLGLLAKDDTTGTAQTATVLAGGALSLYAHVSTSVAFVASGGSFISGSAVWGSQTTQPTITYAQDSKSVAINYSTAATAVAVRWSAGTTPGTYTISGYRSTATAQIAGRSTVTDGSLFGGITVTVVASAAAAGPVVANSTCSVATSATNSPSSADTSTVFTTGDSAYINLALKDAYLATNATSGNIVVTATGDAG